jgi:hypothetical protein
LSTKSNPRGEQDLKQVQAILTTYQESGAIKVVKDFNSKHLIPWFLISKQERGGDQMETNCRLSGVESTLQSPPFKLDHLHQIFPNLMKGHWGAKVDLKDAYFHVPIHQDLKPFLRHQIGDQIWEY